MQIASPKIIIIIRAMEIILLRCVITRNNANYRSMYRYTVQETRNKRPLLRTFIEDTSSCRWIDFWSMFECCRCLTHPLCNCRRNLLCHWYSSPSLFFYPSLCLSFCLSFSLIFPTSIFLLLHLPLKRQHHPSLLNIVSPWHEKRNVTFYVKSK